MSIMVEMEIIGLGTIVQSHTIYEPVHEISNNVVCATSKASDQPAHKRSKQSKL